MGTDIKEIKWGIITNYLKSLDSVLRGIDAEIRQREQERKKYIGTDVVKRYVWRYENAKRKFKKELDNFLDEKFGIVKKEKNKKITEFESEE